MDMKKKFKTYQELKDSKCKDEYGHEIWLGMTGDTKPAFCIKCGKWSNSAPPWDDGEAA